MGVISDEEEGVEALERMLLDNISSSDEDNEITPPAAKKNKKRSVSQSVSIVSTIPSPSHTHTPSYSHYSRKMAGDEDDMSSLFAAAEEVRKCILSYYCKFYFNCGSYLHAVFSSPGRGRGQHFGTYQGST